MPSKMPLTFRDSTVDAETMTLFAPMVISLRVPNPKSPQKSAELCMAIDDIGSPRYALALELDDEGGKSV